MGRELKRVPIDFNWPENKVWSGFLNPHYAKSHTCAACGGSGSTTASQRLSDLVSLLMLSGTDALRGACHPSLRPTRRSASSGCALMTPNMEFRGATPEAEHPSGMES